MSLGTHTKELPTYIYVIGRKQGPVKVGISNAPGSRLGSIQTGCPFKLELLFAVEAKSRDKAIKHERTFHQVYAKQRLSGEWFDLEAELAIEGVETELLQDEYFEAERTEKAAAYEAYGEIIDSGEVTQKELHQATLRFAAAVASWPEYIIPPPSVWLKAKGYRAYLDAKEAAE